MNVTRKKVTRNTQVEVQRWLDRGIYCIPIIRGQKRPPKYLEDWNKLRISSDKIGKYFKPDDSIGGLWGSASGWIVDVDLDCDESVSIAHDLLPATFIYGRSKRPRSHYLYKCNGAVTQKWLESKSMIVELRSSDSQSVLPPSIHPDNDRFAIDEDVPFTTISYGRLKTLLNRIAALSLLARHYPEAGRHDYVSAMAGAMSHTGLGADDVVLYCTSVMSAAGDREDDVRQRERTIRNTIEKSRDKTNRTYGWPKLAEYVGAIPLGRIKSWLVGSASPIPEAVREPVVLTNEVPKAILKPPGLVGDIMQWAGRSAYVKQPVIDLAASLMCVAMASCNRYVVAKWETALQPYMMVMAPTAGGKESALRAVYNFCRSNHLGDYCFQGFQSYHSMLDRLGEPPNLACWLWDEAGRKLKSAGKSSGSQDYQVMTWLLNLYGQAASHVPGLTARGTAIDPMNFPYLSILAASQPSLLMEAVTEADLSTGVVNRFLMFDAGDRPAFVNVQRDKTFPSAIAARVKKIRERAPRDGEFPFWTIEFDNGAYQMFREFEDFAISEACSVEMWGRANQNALILAGIIAVGYGDFPVRIDKHAAAWAIEFVRWSIKRWEIRMTDNVIRSKTEGNSKMVEKLIASARSYKGDVRAPQRALLKKGIMPRAILGKMARNLDKRELDAILAQLIDAEIIGMNDDEGRATYWILDPLNTRTGDE